MDNGGSAGRGGAALAAQYPGQIAQPDKDTQNLRAVAVFEWTGDEAKPKTSRLVPVSIYDGQELEDAGEYLARPSPIALTATSSTIFSMTANPSPSSTWTAQASSRVPG